MRWGRCLTRLLRGERRQCRRTKKTTNFVWRADWCKGLTSARTEAADEPLPYTAAPRRLRCLMCLPQEDSAASMAKAKATATRALAKLTFTTTPRASRSRLVLALLL
eukprot:scaffold7377_cov389-Prasinococcus_capsulatus_cf.AAC.20